MNALAAISSTAHPLWCPLVTVPLHQRSFGGTESRRLRARQLLFQLQDEFLGCTPRRCQPGAFETLCELAVHSSNLDDMFLRGIRFLNLISDHLEINYYRYHNARELVVRLRNPQGANVDLFVETWLCAWHRLACWVVGRHIPLERVTFSHAAPPSRDELTSTFGPVCQFDSVCNSFRFSSDFASLEPTRSSLDVHELVAAGHANPLDIPEIDSVYTELVSAAIRQLSEKWPKDMPSLIRVAGHLHMSPQTLRRKLTEEGTQFKQLKDELRREFVKDALRRSHRALEDIAEQAGFSETSSLIRAFKRWTGMTPNTFRRRG
ncbi:AraC family transcriptional regulator [Parahaliea aestuarii]|uniref:AraC family transcriptional regulator n=1 Tax=Parahaliea aestuarii TaxID=1852021 RepID=A0A5C9A4Y5_9GAMM|nr:AraC family transcriptional regulator [Parahaliea aestuarii]TXS95042.1 AraC family transcriptional regulator [Parahaliea aestuarii]